MASVYPGAKDNFVVDRADADLVGPDLEDARDAINKMQAELEVNPSGSFNDVAARLNARLTCRKTADQASTVTALANVTDMVLPVATTGLDYYFKFVVPYSSAALTTGIGLGVTAPARASGYLSHYTLITGRANESSGAAPAIGNVQQLGMGTADDDRSLSDAVAAINTVYIAVLEGVLSNPSATGSIQLRFHSEVASSAVTVKRGAWGEVYIN